VTRRARQKNKTLCAFEALCEEDIQLFFLDPFRIVQGQKINASAFRLQLKPLARIFLTSVISLARIHH
jgi:hypothetical protein